MTGSADGKKIQDADSLEVAPGFAHEKLEGWVPELAGEEAVVTAPEVREGHLPGLDPRRDAG